MGTVSHSNLEDVFAWHEPRSTFQIEKFAGLRQAGREAALVILNHQDAPSRLEGIDKFARHIERQTGPCADQAEAMACLDTARTFITAAASLSANDEGWAVENEIRATQAIVTTIRGALMWATAAVALEARI